MKEDIFILNEMKSPYMESFQNVLDVANPGNRIWNRHVLERSRGFHRLPRELLISLCRDILQEMRAGATPPKTAVLPELPAGIRLSAEELETFSGS